MCEQALKVHRIRFFQAEVTSINCMCYCEDNHKLAILRRRIRKYKTSQLDTQSVVEIWNMKSSAPFVEQTIYDDSNKPSLLETLVWVPKGRLFSAGLNACINEYDLTNNRIKRSYDVRSGPVWCMTLNATHDKIAVGTEDGSTCVYQVNDDSLEFDKLLDKNEHRILCIDWNKSQDTSTQLVVIGSIDFIKILSYQAGRCVDNIQVSTNGTVVWCLKVLHDMTIVSGDSTGRISFWNGSTTVLIRSYSSHKADILSICTSSDESQLFCSGVDPKVAIFKRVKNSWVESTPRRPHTHDVRAMTYVSPKWLISGGIDSYLTISCYPPNLQLRYLSNMSSKITIIKDYVLLQYETFMQIWRLGKSEDTVSQTEETIEMLALSECAFKLSEIKPRKPIITASFNDNFVVHSDSDNIRIKSWDEHSVKKVRLLFEPIPNATHIQFCGHNFVAVASGTTVFILKLDVMGAVLQTKLTFEHRIYLMTGSNEHLVISTADPMRTIKIYSVDNWMEVSSFGNSSLPTALELNRFSADGILWIAYSNRKISNFNIKSNSLVESFKVQECILPELYQSIDEHWVIKQICFGSDAVIFSDDNNLFKLNTISRKISKCDKYRHIIKLGNGFTSDELVVVEVTPEMLFTRLPRTLAKKKFGV